MSMTGFSGKGASQDVSGVGRISLSIEMKSVNGRFFEVVCKIPSALSSLEIKINHFLQKKLQRGRVYLTIRFAEDNEAFEAIKPSLKNVENYLNAAKLIKERFDVSGELTLPDLFQQPNIFLTGKSDLNKDEEIAILEIIEQVADKLIAVFYEKASVLQRS